VRKHLRRSEATLRELKIDITFDCTDHQRIPFASAAHVHLGLQCCALIKNLVKQYPRPQFASLILVLKKFLAVKGLNSPYHGNLIFDDIKSRRLELLLPDSDARGFPQKRPTLAFKPAFAHLGRSATLSNLYIVPIVLRATVRPGNYNDHRAHLAPTQGSRLSSSDRGSAKP